MSSIYYIYYIFLIIHFHKFLIEKFPLKNKNSFRVFNLNVFFKYSNNCTMFPNFLSEC